MKRQKDPSATHPEPRPHQPATQPQGKRHLHLVCMQESSLPTFKQFGAGTQIGADLGDLTFTVRLSGFILELDIY